jgi:crotonobetainyl-CoA:carnitine CoA-transferase CaiB-like acyl-CoA transferase
MSGPVSNIVVLDLTRILAGPWCTQGLADLGAEVIKVERPGNGDDTRHWGPPWWPDNFRPGASDERRDSTYYAACNRGKKSITVDMASKDGQDLIRRLAETADVVVENYKVGDLKRYGLAYDDLRAINPRLIYCSITGYGQTGSYAERPGYDFVFQGEGGLMSVTGERDDVPGGGPQKVGVAITDILSGMYASVAILAALNHRNLSGEGQYIDLALLDCITAFGANHAQTYLMTGHVPGRLGNAHSAMVPYQLFQTSDGHIIVAPGNDSQWRRLCKAIDRPDLLANEKYATGAGRIAHRGELVPLLEDSFKAESLAYWLERLSANSIPNGPINDYRQVFEHPQAKHRGTRVEIPCTDGDNFPVVGNPIKFSGTPIEYKLPPPKLGEHTHEVLSAKLGLTDEVIERLKRDGVL